MACGLSKSLCLSSSLKMQGITTILGASDCDISSNTSSASSLRRTFSADLSSKNWLSHNGISPMKRISSSEKLRTFDTNSISFSDEEEIEEKEGLRSGSDIWAQIQQDKNKKKMERPAQSDVWGSILTEKKAVDSNTTTDSPPYVHPLMKRASSLSEKSLEICTESLGSETGCEAFSSEIDNEINNQEEIKEEIMAPKLGQGSFPPPIPSLSTQSGSSLHMKTRRHDGRLVMEAVSMPSHTNFCAMRENGRLLLTFAESDKEIDSEEEEEIPDSDEEIENIHNFDDHKINEFENLHRFVQKPIGPVTVHRLAHKPIGVPKRNSKWPEADEIDSKSIAQSLPPRPRVAQLFRSMKPPSTVDDTVGAACFNNTCDYYWKPTKEIEQTKTKTQFHNLVNKSEGWLNGCKEQRRSLLSLEPFCIAT